MERLTAKIEEKSDLTVRVLKIDDGKKALEGACGRLKYPHFTQRNIRQRAIKRMWEAGIDVKLIAKSQGHQDGGKLILNTYTEVFGDNDARYEQQQLAKLLPDPRSNESKID